MRFALPFVAFFSCLVLQADGLAAQMYDGRFGNEWINYSQPYYKLKVWTDGIHRIPRNVLQNAGINISASTADELQLILRGEEVPIHVQISGGQIDYIEFYGEKNRGDWEANMYPRAHWHFNPDYSLVNDTAAYFLTWKTGSGGSNLRYTDRAANLSAVPTREDFYWHTATASVPQAYQQGKAYGIAGEVLYKSTYEYGEGYGSNIVNIHNYTVPISSVFNGTQQARVQMRTYAAGAIVHQPEVRVGATLLSSGQTILGDSVYTIDFNCPVSTFASPNTTIQLRGAASSADVYSVASLKVEYPRQFNFAGASQMRMRLQGFGNRKYIEITNPDVTQASTQPMYIYDLNNRTRTQGFWDGSRLRVDLPAGATQEHDLLFVNHAVANAITTVTQVSSVTFTNYNLQQGNYVIVSHPRLYDDGQGGNPVLSYAAYRASTGFAPVVMDINDLYNQFSYGVEYHPLAVRNMAHYIKANWADAQYIFLIGKGRVSRDMRTAVTPDFVLPTWGSPPSDNVMLARNGTDVPVIPVGRLAATTGAQVRTYLTKIEEVENERSLPQTAQARSWMKNILHLGGGRNSSEQGVIRTALDAMAAIAVQPRYGAHVESFFKTSTSPIQAAQSAYLDSLINGGVSMITFFGHSSANSFDFNLDYPSAYQNHRRYPLILALGCYGGTIFESGQRISEEFVFEPDAGAAVFVASVGAAALGALNDFANRFYRIKGGQYYGKGAALFVQKTIEALETSNAYTTTVQMAAHYMCYHGDPAFNLNAQERPDYYIDNALVSHTPQTVTTQLNTFDLQLDVYNLGEAIDTVFWIEIERQFPDGAVSVIARQQVQAPASSRLITVPVTVGGLQALGINRFNIRVDTDEEIEERPDPSAEQNNSALLYTLNIVSDAVLPVYPAEFAIVPQTPITLKASTGSVIASAQTYVLQIDTTAYFNSAQFRETRITQAGGLLEWTPPVTYSDSTVYYWRVSIDSVSPQSPFQWANSSFIYIQGAFPGWNQSHYFQYLRNSMRSLVLQEGVRRFEYINSVQELLVRNGFTPTPLNNENLAMYMNGNRIDKCNCPFQQGVFVQVIDPLTGTHWSLPNSTPRYGAVNCDAGGRPSTLFLFQTNQPNLSLSQTNQNNLLNFIRDSVPDGHFVAFITLNNAGANNWIPALTQYLTQSGADATALQTLTNSTTGLPYTFFFKKGAPTYVHNADTLGATNGAITELSGFLEGAWTSGDLTWTQIGPAAAWTHLYWDAAAWIGTGAQNDTFSIDLYGLDATQRAQLIATDLRQFDTSLTWIDANQYPYIRAVWKSKDVVNATSPHLNYWRILADEVPEAALRPERFFSLSADTVQRGEYIDLAIAMENISNLDMDSMLVKWQVLGTNTTTPVYTRIAPLTSGDTLIFRTQIPTLDLEGNQQLLIEINPNNDQRERFHFNNIALISFFVIRDRINPLLDVTFDGAHIFNGDIISAAPEIRIQLSDENKHLALNNPEDFTVIVKGAAISGGEMRLDASNVRTEFYPANPNRLSNENRARLHVFPEFTADGIYTLFVSAKDRSNNNSGDLSYSVDFEVALTPAISNMLNYPNPFTTSTQFVFTLTGRDVPDELKIQIFTVSGKLVREIDKSELGALRIGLNRTDFAWDGTDMYGDQLANGVYLYRVVATKNGTQVGNHRNGRIDYMFKDGFGKMYLMR